MTAYVSLKTVFPEDEFKEWCNMLADVAYRYGQAASSFDAIRQIADSMDCENGQHISAMCDHLQRLFRQLERSEGDKIGGPFYRMEREVVEATE